MKVKQVELKQDNGAKMVAWIDSKHAIVGRRLDLNLGEGERSPVMEVTQVWETEQEADEIKDREDLFQIL